MNGKKKTYSAVTDTLLYDLAVDVVRQENALLRASGKPTMDREDSEAMVVRIMKRIRADLARYPAKSEFDRIRAAVTSANNKVAG